MKGQGFLHFKNYGLDLLFKALSIHYSYFSKTGLKAFNSKQKPVDISKYSYEHIEISPSQQVFLFADFLFDEHTLLQKEIKESPHYELMQVLLQNKSPIRANYTRLAKNGSLDTRPSVNYKEAFYRSIFEMRKKEIEENRIKPALVIKINDLYYVLDGRHQLSLCKLLDKNCPCIYIENFDIKNFYASFWKKIRAEKSKKFKTHLAFYNKL